MLPLQSIASFKGSFHPIYTGHLVWSEVFSMCQDGFSQGVKRSVVTDEGSAIIYQDYANWQNMSKSTVLSLTEAKLVNYEKRECSLFNE